ncbi:hypothetical protein M6B38_408545 [Iris pallida]|uniref:Uncharacterized protein n=1 Tax=Iris pallida TaxID=29817 RepID=A0AAX6FQ13_IRIPA|nr:hypothetical protein M6B38_408545 [Iris pallida]
MIWTMNDSIMGITCPYMFICIGIISIQTRLG